MDAYDQQSANKPSAAYYLALIGGILGIVVGVFLVLIYIGIWIIIANVLIIVYGQRLIEEPANSSKYGTYILVLSILGGFNILALIGGIIALTFNPAPAMTAQPTATYSTYAPQPPAQTSGFCPQCGSPTPADAKFCPRCGKQLYL